MIPSLQQQEAAPNRYESNVLNEILYINVGQNAATILEVKDEGEKRRGIHSVPTPDKMSK